MGSLTLSLSKCDIIMKLAAVFHGIACCHARFIVPFSWRLKFIRLFPTFNKIAFLSFFFSTCRKLLLHFFILLPVWALSQEPDTVTCKNIQVVSTRSTIEGFPFTAISPSSATSTSLYITKDFFTKDFKLVSSDPEWVVEGFWYAYFCEHCDIYERFVKGNTVNVAKHPIFPQLKKGEWLEFFCINIVKKGKRFITQDFTVIIE